MKPIPVYGTTFEWSDDGVTYDDIPKPKNIVFPEVSKDYRDVTDMDSANGFREWAAGFRDGGELTISCHYSPDGYEEAAAKDTAGTLVYFRVTMLAAEGQSTGDVFVYRAYVTPSLPSADFDGDFMMDIKLRTSGPITYTKGTAA